MAELDADARNALSGSQFAYTNAAGDHMLPIQDAGHVRAAMARFNQTHFDNDAGRARAKRKIIAAARRFGIQVSDDFVAAAEVEAYRTAKPLLVALSETAFDPAKLAAGELKRLPFAKVGEYNFRDYVGPVKVGPTELAQLVTNFHRDARRQDLPLLVNEEHAEPPDGADLKSYIGPGAVGWIKDLVLEGDTVWADVDPNALGEQVLAGDRYRSTSPELLLNWTDPETDESWGMTAAGLALTTMPRMKSLGVRGHPMGEPKLRARVLAYAERPALMADLASLHVDRALPNLSVAYGFPAQERLPLNTAAGVKGAVARFMTVEATEAERDDAWRRILTAAAEHKVGVPASWKQLSATEAARALLAEGDEEPPALESAELPLCIYQPPVNSIGACPGYTRAPDDGDGDADVCLMAYRGCNGYVPVVSSGATLGMPESPMASMAEGGQVASTPTTPPTPVAATEAAAAPAAAAATAAPAAVVPAAPAPVEAGSDAPLNAANMAEVNSILNAERAGRKAAEAQVTKLSEEVGSLRKTLTDRDTAERLGKASERLAAAVKSGRIAPAEAEKYTEKIAQFAENPWMLDAIEAREPETAIEFRERGSGESTVAAGADDSERMDKAARALMTERSQPVDPKAKGFAENYKEALKEVSARSRRGKA
jgi:hypothetical protein